MQESLASFVFSIRCRVSLVITFPVVHTHIQYSGANVKLPPDFTIPKYCLIC